MRASYSHSGTLITSANGYLFIQHLNYHAVNVIKQLVPASACVHRDMKHAGSLESTQRLEQLLRIFRALQTSRVLHISMNARGRRSQLLISLLNSGDEWMVSLQVTTYYSGEERIQRAIEQPELPGLLKLVGKKTKLDNTLRKANGHKSAEEDFWWACGRCFFERRKKSTIKSHVIQRVCQKSIENKKSKVSSATPLKF